MTEQEIREQVAEYFQLSGEERRFVVQGLAHRQRPIDERDTGLRRPRWRSRKVVVYHEDFVRFARHLSRLAERRASRLAYGWLQRHPGEPSDIGPETRCRVCGYTFDRDVETCEGAQLRAMGALDADA
jgi:hypothetical protein